MLVGNLGSKALRIFSRLGSCSLYGVLVGDFVIKLAYFFLVSSVNSEKVMTTFRVV